MPIVDKTLILGHSVVTLVTINRSHKFGQSSRHSSNQLLCACMQNLETKGTLIYCTEDTVARRLENSVIFVCGGYYRTREGSASQHLNTVSLHICTCHMPQTNIKFILRPGRDFYRYLTYK